MELIWVCRSELHKGLNQDFGASNAVANEDACRLHVLVVFQLRVDGWILSPTLCRSYKLLGFKLRGGQA